MKTCERCGKQFGCDREAGKDHCWCQDLPPVLPVDAAKSCLCPDCLKAAVAEKTKKPC